ncbi:ankyrin repeat domain-containing protein 26-like [Chionomys nivalis]|uniref:ankyrin repeat domain-containing protein 26-like n=1 Tax=Chionomys nivalis TaxID=269649 RepID=UPI00259355E8|nr:ankyrin repeat domain-containing protein 26-like [Chionomys nivalis]
MLLCLFLLLPLPLLLLTAAFVFPGTPAVTTAATSVAVTDLPNAPSPAPTTAAIKTFIPQRNYVEARKPQPAVEETEKHDGLELENASIMATVKNQKKEIEHLQKHLQDTHHSLEPSPSSAPTAAQKNKNISKKHTSVITEMENTIKSLQSEVSRLKTSKESSKRKLEKYKQYYLEEIRNNNLLLYELNRINNTQEKSHTEHHTKFEQNNSVSNSLNTRLIDKCSCVEKPPQLEMEDGQNLVEPSSSSGSSHAYMACSAWMSGNNTRELREELSDLKQPKQLSLEVQKKQKGDVGEPAGHIIGKPFKKINQKHEIGECDTCGDFEICPSGMSTPVSLMQCSAQATAKPYSEFLRENDTTSTTNVTETEIRRLKSMLSKMKVSRALSALELERYKYLYQEELDVRKSLQYYLNKSNKNLETSRTKLHMETQPHRSAVNAQSSRPFTESSSAGYFDSIPGPRISLLPRKTMSASSSNSQLSTSGLEPFLGTANFQEFNTSVPGCDKEAQSLKMSSFVTALEQCLNLCVVLKKLLPLPHTPKPFATPTLTAALSNSLNVGLLQKWPLRGTYRGTALPRCYDDETGGHTAFRAKCLLKQVSDCDELCGLEPQECLWKVGRLLYCISLGQLLNSTGTGRVKMVHYSGSIQSFKQQKGQWEFSPSSLWAPHPDLHFLAVMREHPFHLYVEN